MRRGGKSTKPKADARRPVTRKSPKSEGSKLRQLQERLKEARKREADAAEQQTATSEILRVISAQRDVQPVFDTIVQRAVRLCNATTAGVFRTDGSMLYHPANYGGSPEATVSRQPGAIR